MSCKMRGRCTWLTSEAVAGQSGGLRATPDARKMRCKCCNSLVMRGKNYCPVTSQRGKLETCITYQKGAT